MARATIPPDIREKEKVIGGILSASQLVVIGVGAVLAFLVMNFMFNTTGNVVLSALGLLIAIPFIYIAMHKQKGYENMEYFQYLILKHQFKKSRKEFPNINDNYRK